MDNYKQTWQRLESKRINLMQELSQYDAKTLNKRPEPQKWSILQNIVHLMQAEMFAHAYIKKKLSYGDNLPKAGFKSQMRLGLLRLAFILPFKYKAPAAIEENLPETSDLDSLKNQWAAQRSEFYTYLNGLPEYVFNCELWKHPAAGKLSIPQMLSFFETHVDRHKNQIERTLKIVKSEKYSVFLSFSLFTFHLSLNFYLCSVK